MSDVLYFYVPFVDSRKKEMLNTYFNMTCVFVHQGAASMKEFYVKNSRWTEGLISAAKAVGWGATVMV